MAEIEKLPDGTARMLRDIGHSGSRQMSGDDRDGELMRLAGNPLMIRDFLLRQEEASGRMLSPGNGLGAGVAWQLQQSRSGKPGHGPRASYERRESRVEPSLAPEAFLPSSEDREKAITSLEPALYVWPRAGGMLVLAAFLALLVTAALVFAAF
jgi:hypothetical protein